VVVTPNSDDVLMAQIINSRLPLFERAMATTAARYDGKEFLPAWHALPADFKAPLLAKLAFQHRLSDQEYFAVIKREFGPDNLGGQMLAIVALGKL
jgi:hypothetical protein